MQLCYTEIYNRTTICHYGQTQLLNGGADIVAIQEPLGHSEIELTMRYLRLSNLQTQHDYYRVTENLDLGGASRGENNTM